MSLHSECQKILSGMLALEEAGDTKRRETVDKVVTAMQSVRERIQHLTSYCNVTLVNDGLRDWHMSQIEKEFSSSGSVAGDAGGDSTSGGGGSGGGIEINVNAVSMYVCMYIIL